ncbi:sortase domain-bontaining protein [Naasia sp. SYSU D00057]|uniref:sortase domain-containing protein n=1 Tax=Naasia sp. SYSU D00057 TaxID=2817380 RepID=UPI001B3002E6|nr:sortase [Naasia sp. SYSU D00057]
MREPRHRAALRRPRHRAARSSWRTAVAGTAVLAALTGGAAAASAAVPRPGPVVVPVSAAWAAPGIEAAGLQDPRPLDDGAPAPGVLPARVVIPDIAVDAELAPLALGADGVLPPPADLDSAGWYSGSAVPGAVGPAVLAGHVDDTSRAGVFARLVELRPGARIQVLLSDGTTRDYAVTGSADVAKAEFPTESVYGPTPDSQLRLITCNGPYDFGARHYRNNLVVFATAV